MLTHDRVCVCARSMQNGELFLPMLSYILKNGNVTVYQWKHGQAPTLTGQNGTTETETETEGGIDWGDLDGAGMEPRGDDGINFEEIDFGEFSVEESAAVITLEECGEEGGVTLPEVEEEASEYSGEW